MDKKLSEQAKRNTMIFADMVMVAGALWASIILRYGDLHKDVTPYWVMFLTASVTTVAALYKFGLYRAIVRYIGPSSMVPVIQGVTLGAVCVSLAAYLGQYPSFPRSAPIIFWFISILFVGGSRILVRTYFYGLGSSYLTKEPVAIYGAGDSGAQLAITLLSGNAYTPVAFIDDNRDKRKNIIHGIRVYDSAHVDRLVEQFGIKQIFLAIPSATNQQRAQILNKLASLPILIKSVPSFSDLISGMASVNEMREVEIADLLGREVVPADVELMSESVTDRSIIVTGAGGTIGSEICKKLLKLKPRRLILYDNSEFALYKIEGEIRNLSSDATEIIVLLGSVMNQKYLSLVINQFSVSTIYHAAAFKHVPMVEANVIEGVRNNVVGTWNVARAAFENEVNEVVLVSSDKAVRPTNVMGATKRMAELVIQGYSRKSEKTRFSMVRFGNVLRSSGSVVPLFEDQIRKGGPVTVTHRDATRYFMTTSEAAELVIQAGAMAKGGELFVLDMGEPVRIYDLAVKMIHLHGYEAGVPGDEKQFQNTIPIEVVGLRPGEKLYEELIIGQKVSGTRHPKIMMADEEGLEYDEVQSLCKNLQTACENADYMLVKNILEEYVNDYQMHASNADPMFRAGDMSNITPFVKRDESTKK